MRLRRQWMFALGIFAMACPSNGTSFSSERIECPITQREFTVVTLASWSSFDTPKDLGGIPEVELLQPYTSPHRLFIWFPFEAAKPALSAEEISRVRKFSE